VPLKSHIFLASGGLLLLSVWVWPLPALRLPAFSAHMTAHMVVVAVAAPLLALGVAGGRFDPVVRAPRLCSPIGASIVELFAVWLWHTPALHHAARSSPAPWLLEQTSFLFAGFLLWASALGGTPEQRRQRSLAGILGLLLTSMHMTLLGALIALTPRVLYAHSHGTGALSALADQQLGGAIMLLVGGAAYLFGALGLGADALLRRAEQQP
jgi:putative membrane protein